MKKATTATYSDGKLVLTENQKDVLFALSEEQPARATHVDYATAWSTASAAATLNALRRLGLVSKVELPTYVEGVAAPRFSAAVMWTLTRKGAAWLMVAEKV